MMRNRVKAGVACGVALCALALSGIAFAQAVPQVPGAADGARVRPDNRWDEFNPHPDAEIETPKAPPEEDIPEETKNIHLKLNDVQIEGVTAFSKAEIEAIYLPYLPRYVTLDIAWRIANAITAKYRARGYFLSRAYVPEQRMAGGVLVIKVIEGYIGDVKLDGPLGEQRVMREAIENLKALKPISVSQLESFLLRMNDLPDANFRSVLTPDTDPAAQNSGAVTLALVATDKPGVGSLSYDNNGSRFLGPNEATASYSTSLLPLQRTGISLMGTTENDEVRYGSINHDIRLSPEMALALNVEHTQAQPGFTLKPLVIKSDSTGIDLALNWQYLRQRQENLSFKLDLDGRNSTSDISYAPLTRDKIRALRVGATYDRTDQYDGFNTGTITLSQGIPAFGASEEGDAYLSRASADPDFRKAEMRLSRLQRIDDDWSMLGSITGQLASGQLYSSEEFGYGGQTFGRAYDASEIVGDNGINGMIEVRYRASEPDDWLRFTPYAFLDGGAVWNYDAGQNKTDNAVSAGFGSRLDTIYGFTGNMGLAYPLTRQITNPVYDGKPDGPRILIQIGKEF